MNSSTVWSGENRSTAALRPMTSSTFWMSAEATQASPPRDQSIWMKARASTFASLNEPSAMGSSSTVSQTASTFLSMSALFLLGASSMNVIVRSSPAAAAADPGCVVRPPLPTTSARWPGHCDSATVTPFLGAASAAGAAGAPGALVRSTRVKTTTAIVTIPMANVNILVVALKALAVSTPPNVSWRCFRSAKISGRTERRSCDSWHFEDARPQKIVLPRDPAMSRGRTQLGTSCPRQPRRPPIPRSGLESQSRRRFRSWSRTYISAGSLAFERPHVYLERSAEDLGIDAAEGDGLVHARQLEHGKAADELFRLGERPVEHAQVVVCEREPL